MVDSSTYTPETIKRRQALAEALYNKKQPPMTHWMQGVSQIGDTLVAGMLEQKNKKDQREANEWLATNLSSPGGQQAAAPQMPAPGAAPMPSAAPPVAPPQGAPAQPDSTPVASFDDRFGKWPDGKATVAAALDPRIKDAMFKIESGGRYDALGPITKSGDRAYGVGQVMGANIGPWTEQYYGKRLTPQEYLGNKDAQDAVINGEFGRLVSKYGPEGAAKAWFAGEKGMNNPNAKDVLGTSVADYGRKFMANLGQPSDVSAQSRGAPPLPAQGAPQAQAPSSPPASPPNGNMAMIAEMLRNKNPYISTMGQQLATTALQNQFGETTPTFGVIGKDEFGNEKYGWINPKKQTTLEASQPGTQVASPPPGNAPRTVMGPNNTPIPIPAGVDPKVFRQHVTTAAADAATGKQTEVQSNATQFANRMERAEADIIGVESEGSSAFNRAADAVPFGVGNYLKGESAQKYKQAQSQFITALLRKESGAAISPSEFSRYDKEFFPQPGDSQAVVQQKREARKVAIDAMKKGAGPGYQSPQMASRGPQAGAVEDGYRFKGGNPADPNAWEKVN